jgi:hypothetical protein
LEKQGLKLSELLEVLNPDSALEKIRYFQRQISNA